MIFFGCHIHEISKRKANWIGHILRRNCLLQQVIEGKIKGGIEVTGRRWGRRRKLLDDLTEKRGYCPLREEGLDRAMWRARFGRGFGPVVRPTTRWISNIVTMRIINGSAQQGCTNRGSQIAVVAKFCTVAPTIFWSSVWNLFMSPFWSLKFWGGAYYLLVLSTEIFHVPILTPKILRWRLHFFKNLRTPTLQCCQTTNRVQTWKSARSSLVFITPGIDDK
jgi:hypothetical protein